MSHRNIEEVIMHEKRVKNSSRDHWLIRSQVTFDVCLDNRVSLFHPDQNLRLQF